MPVGRAVGVGFRVAVADGIEVTVGGIIVAVIALVAVGISVADVVPPSVLQLTIASATRKYGRRIRNIM